MKTILQDVEDNFERADAILMEQYDTHMKQILP